MKNNNPKKAVIFIYILLIVNIAIIFSILIYNSSYILKNSIISGQDLGRRFDDICTKGDIAINSVREYNSNGNGFLDIFSCPTNVSFSGTTFSGTNITTSMVYDNGVKFCMWEYDSKNFKIYLNDSYTDYDKIYYEGNMTDIILSSNTNFTIGTDNIITGASIIASEPVSAEYSADKSIDGDNNTYYLSKDLINPYIEYDLGTPKYLSSIIMNKIKKRYYSYTDANRGGLYLYDGSDNELLYIGFNEIKATNNVEFDLGYFGLKNKVQKIRIQIEHGQFDIKEIEIYELISDGSEEVWESATNLGDTDSTFVNFVSDGIVGSDNIDDNYNSDNYKVTSIGDVYYPFGYEDDDVVPRKTFFGFAVPMYYYHNIFWNNYKTNTYISNNQNNNDTINTKIGDVNDGILHLDLFTEGKDILYDLKIIEFDRTKYQQEFTLFPLKTTTTSGLTTKKGYIQYNSGELDLLDYKTGNEYIFDFQNKDYAIFLKNNIDDNIIYEVTGETQSGSGIYLNPIDDSGTGIIEVLSNSMIIGGEKNFIGENMIVTGSK